MQKDSDPKLILLIFNFINKKGNVSRPKKRENMKELLERLLKENHEMIMESNEINDTSYQVGYVQALLNVKSSLEFQLNKLK